MNKSHFKLLFISVLAILFVLSGLSYAQMKTTIKGIVSDEEGNPLPGSNVFLEDLNYGASTDDEGYYSFEIPEKFSTGEVYTLTARYVGYKLKAEEVVLGGGEITQNFALEEDIFMSEAIVVTGIASRTSKDVAQVAVSRVDADELTNINSFQDISQLVAGKVSGVNVKPASGNVGGGIRFNVRSGGGLNGNEQPAIYVDGVRIDNSEIEGFGVGGQGTSTLADLDPENIESINVLKGPAAAASYGTGGSNGAILITTKRGRYFPGEAKPISVFYKFVTGYNTQSFEYQEEDFRSYKSANAIFRDGIVRQHSLSAYGGSGLIKYYIGFDGRYEDGIIPNNFLDRKAWRANLDVVPTENLLINVSAGYTLTENRRPNNDNNIFGFLGNTLLTPIPYSFTDSSSVFALDDEVVNNRFLTSVRTQYTPFRNLQLSFMVGLDDSDLRNDKTYPADHPFSFYPRGSRNIWNRENEQWTFDFNARYMYEIMPGLNAVSIVGAQLFDRRNSTFFVRKYNFLTELITNVGAGEILEDADESRTHTRDAGIFTDNQLSYKNQYYLSLMLRNDYASAIGIEAPNIFYPGVSFAVRLDKYDFFPSFFDLMKVRVAYGESGVLPGLVDGIPLLYEAEPSGYGVGAVLSAIGDEEIKPERIKEYEFGFDTEFLTNYSVELTYYLQKAKDSIIDFRNAPSTGKTASAVPQNVGAIDGWGLESLLRARPLNTSNFRLDISLTNNYQDNEVKDLGGAQPIFGPFDLCVIKEGLPKHSFYTWKVLGAGFDEDGVYTGPITTQQDITDRETLDRFGYTDIDILEADRYDFGSPIPNYTGSLSLNFRFFKNFNLFVLADWATGHKMFNNTKLFAIYLGTAFGMGANNARYLELEDQLGLADWDEELGKTVNPLTPGTDAYKQAADEFAKMDYHYDANYIEDADYFKLREISLSYSFRDLLPMIYADNYIDDLILGFSARNLWTTTKYSGADVELNFDGSRSAVRGQDFLTLQQPRVYTFWLRLAL